MDPADVRGRVVIDDRKVGRVRQNVVGDDDVAGRPRRVELDRITDVDDDVVLFDQHVRGTGRERDAREDARVANGVVGDVDVRRRRIVLQARAVPEVDVQDASSVAIARRVDHDVPDEREVIRLPEVEQLMTACAVGKRSSAASGCSCGIGHAVVCDGAAVHRRGPLKYTPIREMPWKMLFSTAMPGASPPKRAACSDDRCVGCARCPGVGEREPVDPDVGGAHSQDLAPRPRLRSRPRRHGRRWG